MSSHFEARSPRYGLFLVFWVVIQHLILYVTLLLCFFSKGALLGKGNPHQALGGFIQGGSSWYPGVGRITHFFFTKKKTGYKTHF